MLPYPAVLTLLGIGQLISWSAFYYSFSSFVLPMQAALGWDRTVLMGAFSLGLAVWSLTTYAVGAAIDRGHGRWLMTGGSLVGGLGIMLWAQVTQPWMMYAAWAMIGAAMAMTLYEPAFTILTRRYPDRYRQGITALTLVGGFASTVGFPVAAGLLAVTDWRSALMTIGGVLILFVAPAHFLALRGGGEMVLPVSAGSADGPPPERSVALVAAAGTPAFWLLMTTFAFYSFAAAALWAHVMPAFAAKGLSTAQALSVLVWVGPAQVAGRIAFIAFGKGANPRVLGIFVLSGLPVAFALFAMTSHMAGLIAFAVLFGAANGLVSIVRGSLLPEYFGRAHLGRIGGAMSTVALFARAIAPLSVAWVLALTMGYDAVMLGLAALGVLAVASFAMARPPHHAP